MYALTRQVLQKGKHRPLFIYSKNDFYGLEKQRGFIAAVQERLLVPNVLQCPEKIIEATAFLLEKHPDCPDIVITAHDELAVAFLKYSKRSGIKVPEDCNVVGHGDLLLAECCEPELTTLNLHVPQLCETLVSLMIQVLQGDSPSHFITVAADVHARASTDPDLFV